MRIKEVICDDIPLVSISEIPHEDRVCSLESYTLAEIIIMEPRVGELLEEAKHDHRRNRDRQYVVYKRLLSNLVGWWAKNRYLSSSDTYDAAIKALCDALDY